MSINIRNFRFSNKPRIIDWSKPVEEEEEEIEEKERELTDDELVSLQAMKDKLKLEVAELFEVQKEIQTRIDKINEEIEENVGKADIILKSANEESREILTAANKEKEEVQEYRELEEDRLKKEASKIKEDASSDGFREGREEGREIVAGKSISLLKNLEAVLSQAVMEKDSIIVQSEKQILDLSIAISKKIIRTEITINPNVIVETLKQAIAKVTDRDTITVYVNLSDLEKITKRKKEILKNLDPGSRINIVEDSNIEPGGLVISTNMGNIDATISGQEFEMEKILKQSYEKHDTKESE